MEDLDIDKEFANLCPDLTPEEYKLLEQSILDDGCREPIVIWKGNILDGHNRYEICQKHERPFKVKALNLPGRDAALAWIIRNQCGRRNLSESQRAMLAARLSNLTVGANQHVKRTSDEPASKDAPSQADAAKEFGVSRSTVQRASKVIESGSASLQKAVQSGEIPVRSAAVVAELPKAEQNKIVAKGPEAVKAAVKEYRDTFDTAELDKQKPKNGQPKKSEFKDSTIDDAFGQVIKLIDNRWNLNGGHALKHRICVNKVREAYDAWKEWRASK